MKIEKITDNKIRIILNLEDLKANNTDLHSLMSSPIESQDLFTNMLDKAEKEVGFYTKNSKIMIEAIASTKGLFIFTITKVEENSQRKKSLRIKRKNINEDYKKNIFKFSSFEEFCTFCTYILSGNLKSLKGFAKNVSLYLYEEDYYLIITDINPNYSYLKTFYASISEFAKYIPNSENFESKLLEYGKPIMKRNALNRSIYYFG